MVLTKTNQEKENDNRIQLLRKVSRSEQQQIKQRLHKAYKNKYESNQ